MASFLDSEHLHIVMFSLMEVGIARLELQVEALAACLAFGVFEFDLAVYAPVGPRSLAGRSVPLPPLWPGRGPLESARCSRCPG
jgi:hypothetical protein